MGVIGNSVQATKLDIYDYRHHIVEISQAIPVNLNADICYISERDREQIGHLVYGKPIMLKHVKAGVRRVLYEILNTNAHMTLEILAQIDSGGENRLRNGIANALDIIDSDGCNIIVLLPGNFGRTGLKDPKCRLVVYNENPNMEPTKLPFVYKILADWEMALPYMSTEQRVLILNSLSSMGSSELLPKNLLIVMAVMAKMTNNEIMKLLKKFKVKETDIAALEYDMGKSVLHNLNIFRNASPNPEEIFSKHSNLYLRACSLVDFAPAMKTTALGSRIEYTEKAAFSLHLIGCTKVYLPDKYEESIFYPIATLNDVEGMKENLRRHYAASGFGDPFSISIAS